MSNMYFMLYCDINILETMFVALYIALFYEFYPFISHESAVKCHLLDLFSSECVMPFKVILRVDVFILFQRYATMTILSLNDNMV